MLEAQALLVEQFCLCLMPASLTESPVLHYVYFASYMLEKYEYRTGKSASGRAQMDEYLKSESPGSSVMLVCMDVTQLFWTLSV